MPAAYLRRRHARLMLLQNYDNLLFTEPAALHASDSLSVGLYSFLVAFQGSTSKIRGSRQCLNKKLRAYLAHARAELAERRHDYDSDETGICAAHPKRACRPHLKLSRLTPDEIAKQAMLGHARQCLVSFQPYAKQWKDLTSRVRTH